MEILIIIFAVIIAGLLISSTLLSKFKNVSSKTSKGLFRTTVITSIIALGLLVMGIVSITVTTSYAQDHSTEATVSNAASIPGVAGTVGMGFLAMGIAVGLGSLAAGIATGMSASAAIGAISENPKTFGTAIVFVGLSEGVAIYGLIIAILILNNLPKLG
jgi:V/A-type H+/Na+-transporting ATPase subunit K